MRQSVCHVLKYVCSSRHLVDLSPPSPLAYGSQRYRESMSFALQAMQAIAEIGIEVEIESNSSRPGHGLNFTLLSKLKPHRTLTSLPHQPPSLPYNRQQLDLLGFLSTSYSRHPKSQIPTCP